MLCHNPTDMKNLLYYILILFSLAAFAGCATSKSFSKKGLKLEEAGLMEEAAQMYFTSLQKNRNNVDAKIGMKKTGQVVLNSQLQEFVQLKSFGKKREAIDAYHGAQRYVSQISGLGVELNIPDFYVEDYVSLKDEYIHELYEEGMALMDAEQFNEAEAKFNEIKALDPNHNEAKDLAAIAYCEPLYNAGEKALDSELYRAAYESFDAVIKRIPDYKDAAKLRSEAQSAGLFTMAMLPFENSTLRKGLDTKVEAYALEALTSVDDPFLKIVDRNNLELMLEEQKLGLSGVIDEETAVSVGELIGAQAVITGTVLSYNREEGTPVATSKEAYERYQVKRLNAETNKYYYETKYKKTSYREYHRENRVTVSFQFKVISLKTGEIIRSKIVEKEISDEAVWAEYDGELDNLYPARNNGVSLNSRMRSQLHQQMSASRTPRSTEDLTNDIFQAITVEMTDDIAVMLRTLVQ